MAAVGTVAHYTATKPPTLTTDPATYIRVPVVHFAQVVADYIDPGSGTPAPTSGQLWPRS